MNKSKEIPDELLAKYMSGQATSEEKTEVLDYLAENDENLEDFLQICSAVEYSQSIKTKKTIRNRWKRISSVAAAVLIIVVSTFLLQDRRADSLVVQSSSTEGPVEKENVSASQEQMQPIDIQSSQRERTKEQVLQQFTGKNYADSSRKKNYVNMVYPSSESTSVSNGKKSITFRWNTDAVGIHLTIEGADSELVVDKQLPFVKYYTFEFPNEQDTLQWQAVFAFSDGTRAVKEGAIMREGLTNEK